MAKADRSFLFCHGTDSLFWAFVCLGMFVLVQLQFSGNELRLSRKDVEEHRIPAKIHVCTVFNRVWYHNLWHFGNIADVLYGKPKIIGEAIKPEYINTIDPKFHQKTDTCPSKYVGYSTIVGWKIHQM